jgi:hypothetical protein
MGPVRDRAAALELSRTTPVMQLTGVVRSSKMTDQFASARTTTMAPFTAVKVKESLSSSSYAIDYFVSLTVGAPIRSTCPVFSSTDTGNGYTVTLSST